MNTGPATFTDERWAAVLARHSGNGFVYAVRTTGIYCRPSCASRKPRRENVEYFNAPDEAERAGYRACKRCKPREVVPADPWVDKVRRACVYLANVDGHPSLAALAGRIGGSPYHLQRNFTRILGVSPREFTEARRLEKVRARLRQGADVTTAVVGAGFGSSSRFYSGAKAKLGMTPTTYKTGAEGQVIRYAVEASPLGFVLVAATAHGVCKIALGGSNRALVRDLVREFPRATIEPDPHGVGKWTRAVLAHLNGRRPHLDLPLDVLATAFQRMVWDALRAIPRGETRTYSEVARAIGRPQAVRAVAHACAANPVALAVPCHRVVPKAGGTGQYRWGAGRKKALLALEKSGPRKGPGDRQAE
jgi:AraC family transcriptional regulator, regulatory protein of adaptative response / methylated-DNA-[protein]-cysteine methyltransferase